MTSAREYLASPKAMDDLRRLNARFIHNYVTNDVLCHDAMLHPRFLHISGNGARVDRETYLKRWATGFNPEETIYWTSEMS